MSARKLILLAAMGAAVASAGHASQLTVSSYDMPNGDGTAHNGAHNYWDGAYNGAGAVTTDGLSGGVLSGGTGALTDGVIATDPAYLLFTDDGTSQYVGWLQSPTITFNFASNVTVNEIRLYVDNSHVGGITAPSEVFVDGVSAATPPWEFASPPLEIDITGLNITGHSVSVKLQDPTFWVFMSEAQFFGDGAAVPEPSAWALMLLGFGGLGAALRRTRHAARQPA